jgi:hypothetical protein
MTVHGVYLFFFSEKHAKIFLFLFLTSGSTLPNPLYVRTYPGKSPFCNACHFARPDALLDQVGDGVARRRGCMTANTAAGHPLCRSAGAPTQSCGAPLCPPPTARSEDLHGARSSRSPAFSGSRCVQHLACLAAPARLQGCF